MKKTRSQIIVAFFPRLATESATDYMSGYKRLMDKDRSELASAIVRQMNIDPATLDFDLVDY